MTKKYEITNESHPYDSTLKRIKALRDIKRYGVKKGDKGGYVQKEAQLDQYGDAWVYGNARVYGDARVLLGHHKFKDICILQIQGSAHAVCSPDGAVIKIGCQERTPQDWQENFESVGKSNGYTDAQIVEYKRYIDLFAAVFAERNN